MNTLTTAIIASVAILFIVPIFFGLTLIRKYQLGWKLLLMGGLGYLAYQFLMTFVMNAIRLGPPEDASTGVVLLFTVAFVLLLVTVEEGIRYVVYRWWAKEARSWKEGLLLGAGHGGVEALLAGVLILMGFIQMYPYRNIVAQKSIAPYPSSSMADPTSGVTIYYEGNTQVELFSADGKRVVFDVYNPTGLYSVDDAQDILLATHTASTDKTSQIDTDYAASFPGQKLLATAGEIITGSISVHGIASASISTDKPQPEGGSNYIYVVDVDGLRIAHFGIIGELSLTPEQLAELGTVDIAFMQFESATSGIDVQNKIGFNLMDQVKPRLIIPTFLGFKTFEYSVGKWPGYYVEDNSVILTKDLLPAQTQILFLGYGFNQLEEYWNASWYSSLAGVGQRLCMLLVQLACSLLVLLFVVRREIRWMISAIGFHSLASLPVYVISNVYLSLFLLILAAVLAVIIVQRVIQWEGGITKPTG
jgi:uncharacterized membrane protein YhfC